MNSLEVTMPHTLPATGLAAHAKALEAAGLTLRLVARVPLPFKPIADQAIRSATSVPANLGEGHGRGGRDRVHQWRIAYGSAKEVDTHLRLFVHAAAVNAADAANALDLFDQVRAMTWRLLHPTSGSATIRSPV
jgi:four helix bundle protein